MVFLRCICSVGWIFSQPHLEILHISGLRNCGETQTEDVKIYNPRTMTSRASNVMRITETRNSMTWNRSMSRLFSALGKALRHLGKALVKKTEDLLTVGMFQNFIHFFFDRQNFIAVTPIFHIFILWWLACCLFLYVSCDSTKPSFHLNWWKT